MSPELTVLPDGSLVLTLSEGCLQTTLRHAHRALARAVLGSHEVGLHLEDPVDLVAELLTHEPFAAIRAAHPDLASGTGVRVRVFRDDRGAGRWERYGAP
jgi:xanthine/CO dehydrogenase XdhC/CoxF family maturation factor